MHTTICWNETKHKLVNTLVHSSYKHKWCNLSVKLTVTSLTQCRVVHQFPQKIVDWSTSKGYSDPSRAPHTNMQVQNRPRTRTKWMFISGPFSPAIYKTLGMRLNTVCCYTICCHTVSLNHPNKSGGDRQLCFIVAYPPRVHLWQ